MSKVCLEFKCLPVTHLDKMLKKYHSTELYRSEPSLPSISGNRHNDRDQPHQQRHQQHRKPQHNRLSRVSSNSFLLRLLSIEERHEQKKYGKLRDDKDRQESMDGQKDDFSKDYYKQQQDSKSLQQRRASTTSIHRRGSEPRLPNNGGHQDTSSSVGKIESSPTKHTIEPRTMQSDKNPIGHINSTATLSSYDISANSDDSFDNMTNVSDPRYKPLRLPPLLLPPVHSVRPRPLQHRDFLSPTTIRGPISDQEWEDLIQCRYLRHATPRYALKWTSSRSYIH